MPLFCPVCAMPTLSSDDIQAFGKHACCAACAMRWVDLNRAEWAAGWRPSEAQVRQEVNRRRSRPKKINL